MIPTDTSTVDHIRQKLAGLIVDVTRAEGLALLLYGGLEVNDPRDVQYGNEAAGDESRHEDDLLSEPHRTEVI